MNKWAQSSKQLPFTVTSIDTASVTMQDPSVNKPKLLVCVNPGFNVEEWIKIAKFKIPSDLIAMVVVNGNLDRLRNGYYPRIFYPELFDVTQKFYKKFIQTFVIRPVAVSGDRTGCWLVKTFPSKWLLLVKSGTTGKGDYAQKAVYETEPEPKSLWVEAKGLYNQLRGGGLFS